MVKIQVTGPEIKIASRLIQILILKRHASDIFLENLEGWIMIDIMLNHKAQNGRNYQIKEKEF